MRRVQNFSIANKVKHPGNLRKGMHIQLSIIEIWMLFMIRILVYNGTSNKETL